jgi:hypothetical protein
MLNLQSFDVSGNEFGGSVEEIMRLPRLVHLDLSQNQLQGPLPDVFLDVGFIKFDVSDNVRHVAFRCTRAPPSQSLFACRISMLRCLRASASDAAR